MFTANVLFHKTDLRLHDNRILMMCGCTQMNRIDRNNTNCCITVVVTPGNHVCHGYVRADEQAQETGFLSFHVTGCMQSV